MAAKSANQKLLESALEDALDLSRLTTTEREKVYSFLKKLVTKLKGKLAELPDLAQLTESKRKKTLKKFIKEADAEIAAQFKEYGDGFVGVLSDLAVYEAAADVTSISASVGVDIAHSLNLSAAQLQTLVSEAWIDGGTVQEMLDGMEAGFVRDFKALVREGYLSGETTDDIIRRLTGYKDKQGVVHEGLAAMKRSSAENMVRTAMSGIANTARTELYKQNDDILKGMMWNATLDLRTCLECASRDGKAWDLSGKPIDGNTLPYRDIPLHRRCRCTWVPVLKSWQELDIDGVEEFDESTRASMDGQVPGTVDFEEWFTAQSPERQEDILGKGRFELYKQKKISFSDLVDQNGRGLTLKQIYAKKGIKAEKG